jgi:hypothetical protein
MIQSMGEEMGRAEPDRELISEMDGDMAPTGADSRACCVAGCGLAFGGAGCIAYCKYGSRDGCWDGYYGSRLRIVTEMDAEMVRGVAEFRAYL